MELTLFIIIIVALTIWIIALLQASKEKDATIKQMGARLSKVEASYISKLTHSEFLVLIEFTITKLLPQVLQEDVVHYSVTADSNKAKYVSIHANLLVRLTKHFEPHLSVIDAIYGPNYIGDLLTIIMQDMIMDNSSKGLDAQLNRFSNRGE